MAAFSTISTTKLAVNFSLNFSSDYSQFKPSFPSVHYGNPTTTTSPLKFCCFAAKAKQKTGPVKKQPPPSANKTRVKKKNGYSTADKNKKGFVGFEDEDEDEDGEELRASSSQKYQPLPLPKPPAGFVVDDLGNVLMVSDKRITTIVDSVNNLPLECVIRRVFRSSRGEECMLLCPVDTPIQLLKSTFFDEWGPVSDEEVEAMLPAVAYALAKIHMHLVHSGFSFTARGGFSYTEEDIFEYRIDDDVNGSTTNEGVEITCFHSDGTNYMIYTPADPILFVAVKDKNGMLQMADDDLLEDHTIISSIDEETEFNAFVQAEEAALIDSLLGEG